MKRLLGLTALAFAALVLAACGGGGGSDSSSTGSSSSRSTAMTVASKRIDGKSVLVDDKGKALYTSDQETGGMVRCTGACLQFWEPLTIQGSQPSGNVSGATLGVLQRSDGKMQVTFNGAPVYSFTDDQSGTLHADGLTDAFDGQQFTWHAATAAAAPSAPPTTSGSSGRSPGY